MDETNRPQNQLDPPEDTETHSQPAYRDDCGLPQNQLDPPEDTETDNVALRLPDHAVPSKPTRSTRGY